MNKKNILVLGWTCLAFAPACLWAAGATYVKDNITAYTIWDRDESPYVIQKTITVTRGALLLIRPGVEVRFEIAKTPAGEKEKQGPFLVVRGGLKAEGTAAAPISFLPMAGGGLWGGIVFENCESSQSILRRCVVQGGRVSCKGCSPVITESVISGSRRGIDVNEDAKPQIIGNRITSNTFGLVLLSGTSSPEISQNLIYRNKYGLYFKDFGNPTIRYNDIYDNFAYDVVNISPKSLALPDNDFHLVDSKRIRKKVYDGTNKKGLGYVNIIPFGTKGAVESPATGDAEPSSGSQTAKAEAQPAMAESESRQAVTVVATFAPTPLPQTQALGVPKDSGAAEQYVKPFSLSLDVVGQAVITPPYQTWKRPRVSVPERTLVGFGVAFFGDWRLLRFMSLGLGVQYTTLPGSPEWNLAFLDAGGRLYPFGPTEMGEFYLQGGLGLNLTPRSENYYLPGGYHGYAGVGYRFFLESYGGLDLGLHYDYITPFKGPINGLTLKAGWTWLIGK